VPRGDLRIFDSSSLVKDALHVHRMLCTKSSFAVCCCCLRNIASVEDDRLETAVRYPSSGTVAFDCHEELRGRLVGIAPVLMLYRMIFSTALVPQLQMRRLPLLVYIRVQCVSCLH
jgi:hypothetical protein